MIVDLTADERAVVLRALGALDVHTRGEADIVDGIRAKLRMPPPEVLALSVNALGLSVRAANCLANAKIETVGQISATTDRQFLRMNHLGAKTLAEIRGAVERITGERPGPVAGEIG